VALNIKDPETHELASRLARLTGESMTLAVKTALQERLDRQEKSDSRDGRLERIMEIVAHTAPLMKDGKTSKELMDELYDDRTGLPK
jgi:antitoxin VapB